MICWLHEATVAIRLTPSEQQGSLKCYTCQSIRTRRHHADKVFSLLQKTKAALRKTATIHGKMARPASRHLPYLRFVEYRYVTNGDQWNPQDQIPGAIRCFGCCETQVHTRKKNKAAHSASILQKNIHKQNGKGHGVIKQRTHFASTHHLWKHLLFRCKLSQEYFLWVFFLQFPEQETEGFVANVVQKTKIVVLDVGTFLTHNASPDEDTKFDLKCKALSWQCALEIMNTPSFV